MSAGEPYEPIDAADLLMPSGPARLARIDPALRRLPYPVTAALLAGAAVGDGLLRNGRFRRALGWASSRGLRGIDRWRLAFALLANHGRFVAEEALLGIESADDLSRDVTLVGGERLDGLPAGALLLGFHLGPPKTWLVLRGLGHHVRFAGRLEAASRDRRWQRAIAENEVIPLPEGDSRARAAGLYQIRRLLQKGSLVYMTADGPFGAEAFRIDLAGGPLIIRSGWLAVRRATSAPTYPVLTWRERGRRVITICPPLPQPASDIAADSGACREALAPLIASYVQRFPEQCRWVAMPRWPAQRPPAALA